MVEGGSVRCAPGLDSPWLPPGRGTLRGAPTTSAAEANRMSASEVVPHASPFNALGFQDGAARTLTQTAQRSFEHGPATQGAEPKCRPNFCVKRGMLSRSTSRP
jgi:hypothetical protein